MRMLDGTATTPEIVWSVTVTIGVLVSLWALYDALWDLYAARHHAESETRRRVMVVARANVRREAVKLIIQILLLAVGVGAMLTMPGTLPQWFAPGVFITITVLLAVNSLIDRADRHRLLLLVRDKDGL